jgi:hypothetical protein
MARKRKRRNKYKVADLDQEDDRLRENVTVDEDHIRNIDNNPHLEQCRGSKLIYIPQDKSLPDDYPIRISASDAPSLPYRRRHGEVKSTLHWGQRKLMLSEIEFLTKYTTKSLSPYTCVYAGAAPGTHITFLSQLFPLVHFILIDPSEFSIQASDQITIRQEFMTKSIAEEYVGLENLLFISDVRSVDYRAVDRSSLEESIQRDMTWQSDWYKIIKPVAAMLKFRLPWDESVSSYLDGEIYLPVWGPQSTTECRLIIDRAQHSNQVTNEPGLRQYDHQLINNQLFYFNNITRCCVYEHDLYSEELDHCYDCCTEIAILRRYLKSYDQDDHASVLDLSREISVACSSGKRVRSLRDAHHRKAHFSIKRFDHLTQQVTILPDNDDQSLYQAASTRDLLCQHIRSAREELQLAGVEATKSVMRWIDIKEVVWDDVGEDDIRIGVIGGSLVPLDRAIDIWLWHILAELSDLALDQPDRLIDYELHSMPRLNNDEKVSLFYRVWDKHPCSCACRSADDSYMIPALMLLTNSNIAYIFLGHHEHLSVASCSKISLPTTCTPAHHLSLFTTSIIINNTDHEPANLLDSMKSLMLHQAVAIRGRSLSLSSSSMIERQEACRDFLDHDIDFSSSISRHHLLQRTCFESIACCSPLSSSS